MFGALLEEVVEDGPGLPLDVQGYSVVTFLISGEFKAWVNFEASLDGETWFPFEGYVNSQPGATSGYPHCAHVRFNTDGIAFLRPVVAQWASGSVTVHAYAEGRAAYNATHLDGSESPVEIKEGSGILHAVNVHSAGEGSAVTLSDGDTVIADLSSPGSFVYDAKFVTGLSASVADADVTVCWL